MGQYLAIDLGAESGRAILGGLFDGKLAIDELHRFPNTPVREAGGLYWDSWKLWHEIQHGIEIAVGQRRVALDGIGVDTWGVDFGILGPIVSPATLLGSMIEPPHTPVYAVGGHDTASAVAAVPAQGSGDWCYISSGTWSLMGVEIDKPIINEDSLRLNYTNEVGVAG